MTEPTAPVPLEIGLNLPTWPLRDGSYASWPDMRRLARAMDAMGVDTLWVPDHLQRSTAGRGVFGFHECWTILVAAAEATSRIGVGPFIACTGFRNPALLAKMAMTLDEVSGGRLVLGVGSGVPERDLSWRSFGYDVARPIARYAEAAEIVTSLLRAEAPYTFEGAILRTDAAELIPRGPRPTSIPVMLAGAGEKTLAVAARLGDLVSVNRPIASLDDATAVVASAAAACHAVGRDPSTLGVTGWARLTVDEQGIAIEKPGCLAGDPATVADTVRAIHAAGVRHLTFYVGAADDPSPLPALTDAVLDRFGPFLEAIRAA
ncbi:MAG TPA: LLM class flavin-dependent oxidoreductase [Candidatus Limnocylindrales bacterium]|nr:LLM class flavin-dependent oxidoreductase [Candidatus Limnocylindrales bacterium]